MAIINLLYVNKNNIFIKNNYAFQNKNKLSDQGGSILHFCKPLYYL